jgi:hypothetical protein
MKGRAFYNPSKTALETEVAWFSHAPGAQPPERAVLHCASEHLSIDHYFGNSQEHQMKKLVFASVMALASLSLFSAPMLRAQDSTITIKDPAEYNTYINANGLNDPKAKAAALESFLTTYPQSIVKGAVLDTLIDTYSGLRDDANTLSAASRLLQLDPNNLKAILYSVFLKKAQCGMTSDAQTCDDAAALARKGLLAPKPAGTSADDWKKQTGGAYPVFHSAIAFDLAVSKKDFKGAVAEYTAELMLFTDAQTQSGLGLQDTLLLAKAYSQPDAKDLAKSIWFYARAWNFAPASYKPTIEKSLEYYYRKFHGALDGLDDIKAQSALTTFPPGGAPQIKPAKTPAEFAHDALVSGDPAKLNLGDKEFILANGVKEDADKLWTVLKDQVTPVPGIVIEANASVIKVAVTQDAKDAKVADFIVNMKKPLADKEIPAVGYNYKIPPATALVGTYDSYTVVPATDTAPAAALIVLRDGEIQLEKKKPAPVHTTAKPSAAHKPGV